MVKIEEAFKKVLSLEFSSPANALEWNSGEKGWTYMGIYEFAHPGWEGWSTIKRELSLDSNKDRVSSKLYHDQNLAMEVLKFYRINFWDRMRLDEITSQKIAEELFVLAVNAGIGTAVKIAQKLLGVVADGAIGPKTIAALNAYDPVKFDSDFDKAEIAHYEMLAAKNPNFQKFLKGWKNRALAV